MTSSQKRFHLLFGLSFLIVILNIAGWFYEVSKIHWQLLGIKSVFETLSVT